MTMPEAADAAPRDEKLVTTEAVETPRHGVATPDLADIAPALLERLRDSYRQQGIPVTDAVLAAAIAALGATPSGYRAPRGIKAALARLYVARARWGPPVFAIALALVIGLGGYFLGYRPYKAAEAEQARVELDQVLPARLDSLYQAVYDQTKVQSAAADAAELRDRGKDAAAAGNRSDAEQAIADLEALRAQLERAYTLRIIDHPDVKPAFWTFPPNNSEATNYYVVVQALDAEGNVLRLPVTSEDTGVTETVDRWGLRVPQSVYAAVIADKTSNGSIRHGLVGIKQDGFVDVDYVVPVLGGAVTKW